MRIPGLIVSYCLAVPAVAGGIIWIDHARDAAAVRLLNVSCDPTRELWRDINQRFAAAYQDETGVRVFIRQSHGGSASQASAVVEGLPADVVSLAMHSDTDMLRLNRLVAENWERRLPQRSLPYTSTIVFVVRAGNPKRIRDWPDLIREGVQVIVPNPKTSGSGKLAFLAAWGAKRQSGGSDDDARSFVHTLYKHVPVLDTGARGSTTTFAQNGRGDVHLTWENEAYLEVRESGGTLEIVYPPTSILAEPPVTLVDSVVDRRGTRQIATDYLNFLFRTEIQEIIAAHYYRPTDPRVLDRHRDRFPPVEMFPITLVAPSWQAAQERFFAAGGVFDQIYLSK